MADLSRLLAKVAEQGRELALLDQAIAEHASATVGAFRHRWRFYPALMRSIG